jgi:hypothetical protein
MPAGLPGSSAANNILNPDDGNMVIFDLLSGPKGSPFDNDKDYGNAVYPYFGMDTTTPAVANSNASTGALSTGIGFGSPPILDANQITATNPSSNFDDDYTVGVTLPAGTASADSTIMYIGGGKCTKNVDGLAPTVPYTAGFGIGAAGNDGSRDAGAGPAYTGFKLKSVTAVGAVANGAVVETGFVNRSGLALVAGNTVFASASAASATPA